MKTVLNAEIKNPSKSSLVWDRFTAFIKTFAGNRYAGLYISIAYVIIVMPLGLIFHKTGSYQITSENDFFSSYVPHAEWLLKGHFLIDAYRGPVYVFLLLFLKLIFNNYMYAGIIISSASSGFLLLLIHSTLSRIFSGKLALAVILIIAVNPVFILYSYAPGTDMLFSAICAASIFFSLKSKEYKPVSIFLAGLFAGIAFLTRYNAIFLLSIPFLLFIINPAGLRNAQKFAAAALFLVTFIVIVTPWGIYTYEKKGEVFYNQNYRNVAISLSENNFNWENAWSDNSLKYSSLSEIVTNEPGALSSAVISNFVSHLYKNLKCLNTVPAGIFLLLGIIFFRIKRVSKPQLVFYIINLLFFFTLLPVFYDSRFNLFLIPLFSVFSYFGIKALTSYYNLSPAVILIPVVCWALLLSIGFNKEIIKGEKEVEIVAKNYLSKYKAGTRTEFIASRMPHISYELNMRWKLIPFNLSPGKAIVELKKQNVKYLYFSMREYNERKELRELINPSTAPPQLKPLVYFPRERAVLYKIL